MEKKNTPASKFQMRLTVATSKKTSSPKHVALHFHFLCDDT